MTDTATVIARYLAPGGAHVTVEQIAKEAGGDKYTYTTACEACGVFDKGHWTGDAAQYYTQARAAAVAEPHAASCRRVPERLWPEDGTS